MFFFLTSIIIRKFLTLNKYLLLFLLNIKFYATVLLNNIKIEKNDLYLTYNMSDVFV